MRITDILLIKNSRKDVIFKITPYSSSNKTSPLDSIISL